MTPDEHAARAEELLETAEDETRPDVETRLVARAHVHAILASRAPSTPPEQASAPGQASFVMPPGETAITESSGHDPVANPPQPYTGYVPPNEVVEDEPGEYDDAALPEFRHEIIVPSRPEGTGKKPGSAPA
jgi:hypothetical protein